MNEAKYNFDESRSTSYDDAIKRAMPGYDVFHQLTARLANTVLQPADKILLVGAGTGREFEAFDEFSNSWQFTGVEPALKMMELCRQRIANLSLASRVNQLVENISDLPKEPTFNCATALLVMHFLPDDGSKLKFLQEIYLRLKPGGFLFIADLCAQDGIFKQIFLDSWRQSMLIEGAPESEVSEFFSNRLSMVHMCDEARFYSLLNEAGFSKPEPYFCSLLFRSWVAVKK